MAAGNLGSEIKKQGPFASPEQEATLALARTNDQLHLRFERLFRRYNLRPAQYNILRILRGAQMPLPILEIASRTVTVVPGITGLIDRLESAGLVKRRRCTADRRKIYVEITPAALDLLECLDEPVLQLHKQLLGHLSAAELTTLVGLLEKIRCPLIQEESELPASKPEE